MNDVILCSACLVLLLWVIYLKRKVDALTAELEFVKNPKSGSSNKHSGTRQSDVPGMRSYDIS